MGETIWFLGSTFYSLRNCGANVFIGDKCCSVSTRCYLGLWHTLGGTFAISSICVASTIGYFIGRALGVQAIFKLIGEKSEDKVEEFIHTYGMGAEIIFRFSPFLSNDAISSVAGLLKMNYWKFMTATILGITPLILLIAWMSDNMERLKTGLVWISAISLPGFIGYVIYDKYWKK